MNKKQNDIAFDPEEFLNSLIAEIGMADEAPEKVALLKKGMSDEMNYIILNTASLYLEPETLDFVTREYKGIESPILFIAEVIKYSPRAQWAILDALDGFRNQTIEAYNFLKA